MSTLPTRVEEHYIKAQLQYRSVIRTFSRNCYYKLPGFDIEDVEQELLVVLWECVKNYDPTKGAKFNTFLQRSLKNRVVSLIRHAESQKRSANSRTVTLDDGAVRWAVERAQAGTTAEDIAVQRIELQKIAREKGIDFVLNPPIKRRRRKAA